MGYAAIASEVKSANSTFNSYVSSNFKPDSLLAIWSGPAATTMTDDLKKTINKVNTNNGYVDAFVNALNDLEKYKTKKEAIAKKEASKKTYSDQLANTPNTKANATVIQQLRTAINTLQTEINTLTSEANALRTKINSNLASVAPVATTVTEKSNYQSTTQLSEYASLIDDLVSASKSLVELKGSSLYRVYSKEEVEATINQVKSQYSGREAAVNSALAIINMAAEKGKKLEYVWGGGHHHDPHTTLDDVANGTDCSGFASWAVQQGCSADFQTAPCAYLINRGRDVEYQYAQAGDILVCGSHVCLIVKNDPVNGVFYTAESTGGGAVVKKRSYSSVKGQYKARDLSEYY